MSLFPRHKCITERDKSKKSLDINIPACVMYYFQEKINNPISKVEDVSKTLLFRKNNAVLRKVKKKKISHDLC